MVIFNDCYSCNLIVYLLQAFVTYSKVVPYLFIVVCPYTVGFFSVSFVSFKELSERSHQMSTPYTSTGTLPNRWIIAIAAFFMQLALGAVYAWSVFLTPVITLYHTTKPAANLTFTLALVALGITAGFGGYLNSRFGPRAIATAGGICYGLGIILAAFTAPNLYLLYLTYGILGGIGLGLGYIVALAMLIKWFPDRRGFITGLAVAGFGGGAVITAPVAASLIKSIGVGNTFLYLGIAYLVVVVVAAQFFRTA